MLPIKQKPLPDPAAFEPGNKPIRKERLDEQGNEMKTPDVKKEYNQAHDQRQQEKKG